MIGRDVEEDRRQLVAKSLIENALRSQTITDIHNVRVRATDHGLIVNYHCRVDPNLEVTIVHDAVDQLEHRVRKESPDILRIVSHTEPVR